MLETSISELCAAVVTLTQVIQSINSSVSSAPLTPIATPAPTPAPVVIPVFTAPPAPVAPVAAPVMPPAAVMPPPPVFAVPVAPVGAPVLPFTDGPSLVAYVMRSYKEMQPTKGARIQNVLASMGCQNLTDVKPEQYAAFYMEIETLKASA